MEKSKARAAQKPRRSSRRNGGNGGKPRQSNPRGLRKSENAPVAYNTTISSYRNNQPTILTRGAVTVVSNMEFFGTYSSTATTFNATSYACNPGVPDMFPWLSGIANQYEKYRFRKLVFHYITRAATTAVGNVAIAFDYDAMDPIPGDFLTLASYKDKSIGCVWKDATIVLNLRDDLALARYVRSTVPAGNYDLKTYDIGQLIVGADGVSAAIMGVMGVEYTVELITPQSQQTLAGCTTASAGLDATHLVGSNWVSDQQGVIPVSNINPATGIASTSVLYQTAAYWQGMMVIRITGAAGLAADWAPVTSGSSTVTVVNQVVNAATTEVLVYCRLGPSHIWQ